VQPHRLEPHRLKIKLQIALMIIGIGVRVGIEQLVDLT
jgi:hypothetical protein